MEQNGANPNPDYGWAFVGGGVELPYITRPPGNNKYIPVKLIDRLILRHYPSTYPKELADKPPLICQFLTSQEAGILSDICERRYDTSNLVGTLDPIVNLQEFQLFFSIVQESYPEVRIPHDVNSLTKQAIRCGWLLCQDAMIPYIERADTFLLPLNVIHGAAKLMIGLDVKTHSSTQAETDCFNAMCKKAGMTFAFHSPTELVDLTTVALSCPGCTIRQLPPDDPMSGLVPLNHNAEDGSVTYKTVGSLTAPPEMTVIPSLPPPPPLMPINLVPVQLVPGNLPGSVPVTAAPPAETKPSENRQIKQKEDILAPHKVNSDVNVSEMSIIQSTHQQQRDQQHELQLMPSSRTTDSNKRVLETKQEKEAVPINPVDCYGKTISCITRGKLKTKYALVEAICRVFFPRCDLLEFVHCLEHDLSVILYGLKKTEEAAFIKFFGIPTNQLCCNLLIKLKDFLDRMTWLLDRFGSDGLSPGECKSVKVRTSGQTSVSKHSTSPVHGPATGPPALEPITTLHGTSPNTAEQQPSAQSALEQAVNKLIQQQTRLGIPPGGATPAVGVGEPSPWQPQDPLPNPSFSFQKRRKNKRKWPVASTSPILPSTYATNGLDLSTRANNPPAEGNNLTMEGGSPPKEGNNPIIESNNPLTEGNNPPTEGNNTSTGGNNTFTEDNNTSTEGNNPPIGGST